MATTILAKNIDFEPERVSYEAIIFYDSNFVYCKWIAGCTN